MIYTSGSKTQRAKNVIKKWVRPNIHDRQCHVYCVGMPRTGTTSIQRLFSDSFRSWHEPYFLRLTELAMDRAKGSICDPELSDYFERRDRQMWLDMESSHVLSFFSDLLASSFSDAKFILTVREPESWLRSVWLFVGSAQSFY